jgi:hypothetical protein
VGGLLVREGVKATPQCLSVHGYGHEAFVRTRRRERSGMLTKSRLQGFAIGALDDPAQARVRGRITQSQPERFVQPIAMNANEFMQLPVRIGPGDHAEDRLQQHGGEFEPLTFLAPTVGNRTQNLVERLRQATTSDSGCRV